MKALVKRKAAGKTIEVPERAEVGSNVINLMDALKQSLGRGKAKAGGRKRAGKSPGRKRKAA